MPSEPWLPSPFEPLKQFHQDRVDFARAKMEERYAQGNYEDPTLGEMLGWANEDMNNQFYSGDSSDVFDAK